jgi:hypothetical protein
MNLFYRRWVVANAWSEGLGLGTTFVLGGLLAPLFAGLASATGIVAAAVTAIVMGVALEGVLVGVAQDRVLRRALVGLPRFAWISATAIGAGIAWTLGLVPSTLIGLLAGTSAQPSGEPGAVLKYSLAAAMGAVTGPVLGAAQWRVLRLHVRDAQRWLWANAVAWAVGMLLVFAGMDLVPWAAPRVAIWATIYLVCTVAGLAVGAIHGRVLRAMLRTSKPAESSGQLRAA